jgi:hypothetical protein
MKLIDILNKLFAFLKLWGLPVCNALNEGLDIQTIKTHFEEIQL